MTLLEAALASAGVAARSGGRGGGRAAPGARSDDVADALAIALVARDLADGRVERLGDGGRDRRGLRMEIVA